MIGKPQPDFRGWTCHAPDERVARLSEIIKGVVNPANVRGVLDIGCGTGLQVRQLAEMFPDALLVGIDISPANVEAAKLAAGTASNRSRMRFLAGDYLATTFPERFDLVVTDGVLHLIDGADDQLADKLASDVAVGGTLVITMAADCLYNRVFALVRRGLAAIRTPLTDRLILGVARLLYRRMNETMLKERVPYMYTPPTRLMGERFRGALASHGLHQVAVHAIRNSSVSQLKHAASVFRRA